MKTRTSWTYRLLGGVFVGIFASTISTHSTASHGISDGTQIKQNVLYQLAQTPYQLSHAQLDNLANHVLWQRLLLFKNNQSQIKDRAFFLATDGSTNAKAELIATLNAMQAQDSEVLCRFPARVHFLQTTLQKLGVNVQTHQCQAVEEWLDKLDGRALSLIFAEENPNVPASAFAHVFLRLDNQKSLQSGQDTDATAINYSVISPTNNTNPATLALSAIKSSMGGFAGGIEILNLADKQNEYLIDNERDLWQYSLDLTPSQVRQILRHLWESKEFARPYFFSHNNCATEIVRLIDVVRADKNLTHATGNIVIPAKIVRVLDKQGMIRHEQFIASNASKHQALINHGHALSQDEPQPSHNNPKDAVPTHRLSVMVDTQDSYGLSVRSAYHDLLDPPAGVRKFLDLELLSLQITHQNSQTKLDNATIFATRSYNPSNSAKINAKATKQTQAWGIDIGFRRVFDASNFANHDHLVFHLRQEKGKSWVVGTAKAGTGELPNGLCYTLANWGAQLGNINQGYRLGVGVSAGCVRHVSDNLRLSGELVLPLWYHYDRSADRSAYLQPRAQASVQYDLNPRHSLRLTAQLEKLHKDHDHQVKLHYLTYF